jgi:HEAT repeat protein
VVGDSVLERAVGELQGQFKSGDAVTRANCVEGLQPLWDPRGTAVIAQALADEEWVVRFAGAMAAGKRKLEELKPALERMVREDGNGGVRVAAVYALRKMAEPGHEEVVRAALADKDPSVRASAAMVIGLRGDSSAMGLLQGRSAERDDRVRMETTVALARLGDAKAQEVITALAISKYHEDQMLAMEVCGDLTDGVSLRALAVGVQEPPREVAEKMSAEERELLLEKQLVAARSLARRGSMVGAELARSHLWDGDAEVRALAALALGEILSPRGALQRLGPLLEDKDAGVRRAAAAAVVRAYARDRG